MKTSTTYSFFSPVDTDFVANNVELTFILTLREELDWSHHGRYPIRIIRSVLALMPIQHIGLAHP